MPFSELRIRTYGLPGGRPLLLLHGGGVAGWMWRPLIDQLGNRFRVMVPELPGHDVDSQESYRSHAESVARLALLLKAHAPVTVVGFSLGAQLAVLLAAEHPDRVERVVVVSAQAIPTRWPAATLRMLTVAAPLARYEWFARLQAKELFVPEALMPDYIRTSRHISLETLVNAVGENIRFTVPDKWATFPGEAMVLAGSRERAVMRASAWQLHEALPGSAFSLVSGCAHGIPLQRPDLLAKMLDG